MESNPSVAGASTIPSELTGQLPRRTIATGDSTAANVFVVILLVLEICFFLWFGKGAMQQMQQREALRSDSRETTGEIIKWLSTRRPKVKYSFTANGKLYTGEARLPDQLENNLAKSSAITIRYLPTNPAVNHPAAWEWSVLLDLDSFVDPALFFLTPVIFACLAFNRERRIVAEGTPTVATITKCTPGPSGCSIRYEFQAADGRAIKGSGMCNSRPEVGEGIWILYLPQNPRRNRPYPSPDYVVAE